MAAQTALMQAPLGRDSSSKPSTYQVIDIVGRKSDEETSIASLLVATMFRGRLPPQTFGLLHLHYHSYYGERATRRRQKKHIAAAYTHMAGPYRSVPDGPQP
jgi:hypothetical protein